MNLKGTKAAYKSIVHGVFLLFAAEVVSFFLTLSLL